MVYAEGAHAEERRERRLLQCEAVQWQRGGALGLVCWAKETPRMQPTVINPTATQSVRLGCSPTTNGEVTCAGPRHGSRSRSSAGLQCRTHDGDGKGRCRQGCDERLRRERQCQDVQQ